MHNLKIVDYRTKILEDSDVQDILKEVSSGKWQQVQVLCNNQTLAEYVREKVLKAALIDGRQFEMTILGSGAAVGIKMHIPDKYTWTPEDGQISIEDYRKKYGNNAGI